MATRFHSFQDVSCTSRHAITSVCLGHSEPESMRPDSNDCAGVDRDIKPENMPRGLTASHVAVDCALRALRAIHSPTYAALCERGANPVDHANVGDGGEL